MVHYSRTKYLKFHDNSNCDNSPIKMHYNNQIVREFAKSEEKRSQGLRENKGEVSRVITSFSIAFRASFGGRGSFPISKNHRLLLPR